MKQAVAAIGQSRLMHYYETALRLYGDGLCTAQVLITAGELDNRVTYLNIRNTIQALFRMKKVVPVVNENDSVATEELCFGDNDTLAARVAAKAGADLLVLLSDIDGLYDKNPRKHSDARLVEYVPALTDEIDALAEDTTTETSIGGMKTKLRAARIASAAGLPMAIADGRRDNILHDVLARRGPMTWFGFSGAAMSQRKRWIAFGRATRGILIVDDGAARALREKGRSLLPAGITAVRGSFNVGDAVQVADQWGRPVAQGLANYGSDQVERIRGRKTAEIRAALGRCDFDEVIHRDNLVLL
jgi:glutamate 5-kinase